MSNLLKNNMYKFPQKTGGIVRIRNNSIRLFSLKTVNLEKK